MESSEGLRTHGRLSKEDGDSNCKERDRPCNLVDVQRYGAFHRLLHTFHCHGKARTVLSGNLCKVSRLVGSLKM
jgi:hypothetical protein